MRLLSPKSQPSLQLFLHFDEIFRAQLLKAWLIVIYLRLKEDVSKD